MGHVKKDTSTPSVKNIYDSAGFMDVTCTLMDLVCLARPIYIHMTWTSSSHLHCKHDFSQRVNEHCATFLPVGFDGIPLGQFIFCSYTVFSKVVLENIFQGTNVTIFCCLDQFKDINRIIF